MPFKKRIFWCIKVLCTTSFNIIHQFNLLVTKIKKFSSLLKRISRLKWNFTILCTKGVKSFLTTMKIHFYLQNESHSCSCTHIPVKSALREQGRCCASLCETDVVSRVLNRIFSFLLKPCIIVLKINSIFSKNVLKVARKKLWKVWTGLCKRNLSTNCSFSEFT